VALKLIFLTPTIIGEKFVWTVAMYLEILADCCGVEIYFSFLFIFYT
jgi:hypothetical protein